MSVRITLPFWVKKRISNQKAGLGRRKGLSLPVKRRHGQIRKYQ
jgi:hypothetical protein